MTLTAVPAASSTPTAPRADLTTIGARLAYGAAMAALWVAGCLFLGAVAGAAVRLFTLGYHFAR